MKNLIKLGIMSGALGFMFVAADTVNAQSRRDERREYRQDVRRAQREYRDDIRDGDSRREARREYRNSVREARRDYRRDVRRGNDGWYWFQNGRRYVRPFSQWNYRNGWFYQRY